eukprot:8000755-Ditylum_brightwellii.AAC.2
MKNGPTESQLHDLEQSLENNGCTCGKKIKVCGSKFYTRQAICCGDPIEAYYYNPLKEMRGGRIVTDDICSVCYIDEDLVSPTEIRQMCDLGSKTSLITYRACVDNSDIDVPASGAEKNKK